jgi:alpha-glucuronidase
VVERVTSGHSLWEWFQLPWHVNPRYRDYARACASVGINGTVLTNVNANALVLTPAYLDKVAALADAMRPYNVASTYGPLQRAHGDRRLKTATPSTRRRPRVEDKADEIYAACPDSEASSSRQTPRQPARRLQRSHAEGANSRRRRGAPRSIVMWRAFVYSAEGQGRSSRLIRSPAARGLFRPLVVQIKNGPQDFMPREALPPAFGAMPETALGLELQITQEYLGFSIDLAFLAPMWEEVLDSDTYAQGAGSTVARVVEGSLDGHELGVMAGVSNVSNARNWTGHPMGAANWYAFGRLAWDPSLPSARIAEEWTRMTFSNEPAVVEPHPHADGVAGPCEYEMPLGRHHILAMARITPGPRAEQGRADWTSVYYHRAD